MTRPTSNPIDEAARGQVSRTAADVYETFFVPSLFGQFPARVLDSAQVGAGDRVLDVGCGTGIVARAARARVGPGPHVAGIDPNAGMLAVARRTDATIDWTDGYAEQLPFHDASFDRTISQFAAMFFTDLDVAIDEMRRVTAHGGTIGVATWAGLDRSPGYDAMVALVDELLGGDCADALRAPFALGTADRLRTLVDRAGSDVRIVELAGTARFPSIADWVHTEVRGWTLAELVDDAHEARLVAAAERRLTRFVSASGEVAFPAPALLAIARC
jgi:SAM-dependent methyltransferase